MMAGVIGAAVALLASALLRWRARAAMRAQKLHWVRCYWAELSDERRLEVMRMHERLALRRPGPLTWDEAPSADAVEREFQETLEAIAQAGAEKDLKLDVLLEQVEGHGLDQGVGQGGGRRERARGAAA